MNEAWKNTSIFSGIRQYLDDQGNEWRQIANGMQYGFYIKQDNAFILQGNALPEHRKASIYKAHKLFLQLGDDEE